MAENATRWRGPVSGMIEGSGKFSGGLSPVDSFVAARPRGQDFQTEGDAWFERHLNLVILVFALNVLSSALFIGLVNRPVYDDHHNISDVQSYAHKGLSIATVLSQRNPPGPTSFLWMAAGVRLLGGDELRDARIATLLSWAFLLVGILVGARYSSFPQIWYGALLTALIFPHSVEATATVLTEGPALLFATLGALAWIESASRPTATPSGLLLGILGGLSMGIAVTCRQYYLALLPAAALFAPFQLRGQGSSEKLLRSLGIILSLMVASAPVIVLIILWRGISSPGMATGTSYNVWKAGVGLNVFRPIVATFYACFYLMPLTLPVLWRVRRAAHWRALVIASFGGVVAAYLRSSLLQPGPLHTIVLTASRLPAGEFILFSLIATLTIYNAIEIGLLLWEKREMVLSCPLLLFALLTVVFFIGEQLGVGGNLPLYDRYLLQIAPFLGIIAFSITPRLTSARLLVLAALSAVSHMMLWRYAFGA
jgi:hypothetical protein